MTEDRTPYPVRVDAALDAPLSRWLWLVKWFLLIPHYVVLAFLWIAFTVLTVVAWVAILVTGRYPRALFDFNVGVLRWSWRVHYYGYAALGTDRYPPFTLADVPDYPARLDVPYPERLSRGLVLVKSWLLAIPHWLVLAVFVGGGLWFGASAADDGAWDGGWGAGGLVGLLVLVAGVVLLFTDRYPAPVYDFVMGMDRWVLRVIAYVALMTDRYPPFRLDTGGADPGTRPVGPGPGPFPQAAPPAAAPAAAPPAAGPAAAPAPSSWTAGRVVAVVVGALLLMTSTGLLVGGGSLAWADTTQREDGFVMTQREDLTTARYALVSGSVTLDTAGDEWLIDDVLGRAQLEVTPTDPGTEVFVGVGRTADVQSWLQGVGYRELDDLGPTGEPRGRDVAGGAPPGPPGEQDLWVAQDEGTGTRTLTWRPADGDWTTVVMRADGTAGVDVTARAGLTAPGLTWLWVGLLVTGGALLLAGALLVALAVRGAHRGPAGAVPAPPGPPGPVSPPAPRDAPSADRPAGTAPGGPR
ncbi:DUF4389 domain-containing protein [Geodermatophilus sp. SYSU D00758]